MLTYTQLIDDYKTFTEDKTSENATWGGSQINSAIKARLGEDDWIFLETNYTQDTVADQQGYYIPVNLAQMRTVTVEDGSTVWPLVEVPTRAAWDQLNVITYTSDIAQYYYIQNNQVLLFPTPASSGNTITFNYKKRVQKLTVSDYTTGTVAITSADQTVTGSGTTFTEAMEGLYLMTTDGYWYLIQDYTSATALELLTPYLGPTITGQTYTIGQLSPIPDAYEEMPVYDATADYFTRKGNFDKAKAFRELGDGLAKKMRDEQGAKSTSPRLRHGNEGGMINPNLFARL